MIAVLNNALSVYYYLRVLVALYMRKPMRELVLGRSALVGAVVLVCALGTFWVRFAPDSFVPGNFHDRELGQGLGPRSPLAFCHGTANLRYRTLRRCRSVDWMGPIPSLHQSTLGCDRIGLGGSSSCSAHW
ncbi:MAG: hypothetical protein R3E12_19505 [Candidatus Eisenbacteria bacterium]